ncbi:MAG: hypothetical protein ACE5JQ_01020 [Candidatus Methylomirabilales bacterium]
MDRVVPAEYSDEADVYELCSQQFSLERDRFARLWEWMYLWNPAYRSGDPVGWKAERSGRLISYLGAIPSWLCVGKEVVRAYLSTNYASREGEGIVGLKLARAFLETKGAIVMNGSANVASTSIFGRLGCRVVPGVAATRYLFPLSTHPLKVILVRKLNNPRLGSLGRRRLRVAKAMARLAGPIAGPLLSTAFGINQWRLKAVALHRKFSYEPLDQPGPELSQIWELSRAMFPVSVRRDPAYIRWRFFEYPFPNLRVYMVSGCDGRQVAYFVLQRMTAYPALRLLDLGYDPAKRDALSAAILFTLCEVTAQGSKLFVAWGHCATIDRELARWVLLRQRLAVSPYMFRNNSNADAGLLSNPSKWWWSACESDISYDWSGGCQ